MTTEQIQQLVTDWFDAYNAHDAARVTALCAQDYTGTDVGRAAPYRGADELRQTLVDYFRAFPDIVFTPEDTIVECDRVAQVWTARGTHRGTLMNIPPTGREVSVRGVSVLTLCDGKVQHGLFLWDVAGLLRAIGLLPEL